MVPVTEGVARCWVRWAGCRPARVGPRSLPPVCLTVTPPRGECLTCSPPRGLAPAFAPAHVASFSLTCPSTRFGRSPAHRLLSSSDARAPLPRQTFALPVFPASLFPLTHSAWVGRAPPPSEVRPALRGRHVVVGPQQQAQAVRPGAPARGLAAVPVDAAGHRRRGVYSARHRHHPGAAVDGCDRRLLPQRGRRCGPHGGLCRGPAHRPPHPERADVPARAWWLPALSCAACVLLRWGCPVSPLGPACVCMSASLPSSRSSPPFIVLGHA